MRAPGLPGLAGLGTMECFCLWAGHAMDIKPAHDTDCQTVACYLMHASRCWGLNREPALT